MRSVGQGREPGDSEIKEFAELVSRPLLVVGNGPSAAMPRHDLIPADVVIFRMNWFFLESHYHFGNQVDAWFSSVPNNQLERMLAEEARTGRYQLDRIMTPVELASKRDTDRWENHFLEVDVPDFDSWSIAARHPRLGRYFMSRPGLPTTGMQALAFGLGVGFREVYLTGIDLYESAHARYGYTVPEEVQAGLREKDLKPGYEDAHSVGTDLSFLRSCMVEFPEAKITNLCASETLELYLPGPTPLDDRPSMSTETITLLGQNKTRPVIVLPGAEDAPTLEVREPLNTQLYADVAGRKCAYVTVVSGSYHHGARALANSLRKFSDIPLLALCTPDANVNALLASGIHVIDVPPIVNPITSGTAKAGKGSAQARFSATYTKLHTFRLDFLDRAVYVDSDAVVLQDIDDLFEGDDFAAVPDSGIDLPTGEYFNSGVFAVTPSYELFDAMMAQLRYTPSYDGGDQGFLNVFFDVWRPLPMEFNTTKRIFSHHSALFIDDDIKVLHYVGPKPWQPAEAGGRYDELDVRWLDHLQPWELKELVRDLRNLTAESSRPKVRIRPPSPHKQAQLLAAQQRWSAIESVLKSAWETRDPTTGELRQLARAYRKLGRYEDSFAQLKRAHLLAPRSAAIAREKRNARIRMIYSRSGPLPKALRRLTITDPIRRALQ